MWGWIVAAALVAIGLALFARWRWRACLVGLFWCGGEAVSTTLTSSDSPKMLRETLCVAQTYVGQSGLARADDDIARLQRLIDECDRHRPLGPDGKHGDRHTDTCGCEDR